MNRPKRIPALLSALVLALGLITPALAAGSGYSPTLEDFQTHFDLDVSDGHNEDVNFRLLNWGYDESEMEPYYYGHWDEPTYVQPEQLTSYCQVPSDAVFTVANTAKGIDCKLTISMSCWSNHAYDVEMLPESSGSGSFGGVNAASGGAGTEMRLPEGDYLYLNTADLWLYKDKTWNEYIGYPPPEDLMLTLTPGQSRTFDLSEIHLEGQGMSALADPKNDNIYTIYISITYANGKRMYAGYVFHTGEKGGETRTGLYPLFDEHSKSETDVSMGYHYTFTNYTGEAIDGYYLLLSYSPQYHTAQLHEFDIKLQPGQSTSGTLYSQSVPLSDREFAWIIFDSKEERDGVLNSSALRDVYGQCYVIEDEQWMKDTFGITY